MRDWGYFYDKLIRGLINQKIKETLREFQPNPLDNHEQFRQRLIFLANVQRKRLMAGECSDAEAVGAEAHSALMTYRSQNRDRDLFREVKRESPFRKERVMSLEATEAVNALKVGAKPRGICYYCGNNGHFIAACPRRVSGLPAAVVAAVEAQEALEAAEDGVHYVQTPFRQNAGYKTYYHPMHKQGQSNAQPGAAYKQKPAFRGRGRFHRAGKRYNARIAFLYEDENGETVQEEYLYKDEEPDQDPKGTEPRVSAVSDVMAGLGLSDPKGVDRQWVQDSTGFLYQC